jgi:xanthine/CO dehydrogenase XdhC/CoxF family maturation factor
MEAGLEAVDYYDPPNLTFPFGSYICVVDIDKGTGEVKVRRFVAVDDCGNIINPMIVEGQIHGGLTMGLAPALYEEIVYDENGQNLTGTFADYLLPTAVESPRWELGRTITPSPHHPIGAKGVGESPTVGAPPAIANAVVDALWHLGVRHIDIPPRPKVWKLLREKGGLRRCANLSGRIAELEAAGGSFAVATVVAVQRPTSARPGARGIVHPDGTIEGWVGGSCAQPVVVREALRALVDGHPRLLRLSKQTPAEGRRADGIVELVMSCHSGGTLEIYVEPRLPAPSLWVAGTTPIVGALVTLGSALGWRVSVFDPIADPDAFPDAERVSTETSLGRVEPESSPYVVVATQGIWDEEALASALRRDVSYVGLVASPTRAAHVRGWLREEASMPEDRLAALRAPAGLESGRDA